MRGRMVVGAVLLGAIAVAPVAGTHALLPTERGYVTNAVFVPESPEEAQAMSRDLDGDGTKDNQLANWYVALTQATGSSAVAYPWNDAIQSGEIVMLHSLRANSLANTRNATWQVWYGAPTVGPPDFTGNGTFELLSGQPHSGMMDATIKNHNVKTVAGKIPVRLDLGAGPFVLRMTKAKIFGTCFQAGCNPVKINGAISTAQIQGKFVPELAEGAQAYVEADCPGPDADSCEDGSTGEAMVGIFDTEDDGFDISLAEVQDNTLVQTVLRPDLNLVKGDGGAFDSISFGFGFSTVHATLERP